MNNKEAIANLNHIYGMVAPDIQKSLDVAFKAMEKQGDWIPVSERLPDKNMYCLVSVGKIHLTQIAMYSDLMGTIDHRIFWQGDYGKNNFQNITEYVRAWQPLPEPYKEGGAK